MPPSRNAFEHSPSAILFFRPCGTIEDLNTAFCRMLGYDRRDLEGGNWWNLIEAPSVESALRGAARVMEGRAGVAEFEAGLRGRAGGRVTCLAQVARVPGGEDPPLLHAVLMDITATAAMQADLAARVARIERQLSEHHRTAAGMRPRQK